MGNLPSPPEEFNLDVIVWRRLGLSLAPTPKELDKVPNILVEDWLILLDAIDDYHEWQTLNPKKS